MVDQITQDVEEICCCPTCGNLAAMQGRGTRFYTPVACEYLDTLMDKNSTDAYILDRLRRAEKIITALRKELKDGTNRNS